MKFINKIRDILYAAAHASQLLTELQTRRTTICNLNAELKVLKGQLRDAEKKADQLNDRGLSLTYELEALKPWCDALEAAAKEMHSFINGGQLFTEQAKAIYDAVAPHLDKEGFRLFETAEGILGKFSYSAFAYEDNCGYFEEADGYAMLNALLVQYDYMLGEANDKKSRWEIACSCYEKCVDFSIDETTPEYKEFEKQLYIRVLEKLRILSPAETQAKEVAA